MGFSGDSWRTMFDDCSRETFSRPTERRECDSRLQDNEQDSTCFTAVALVGFLDDFPSSHRPQNRDPVDNLADMDGEFLGAVRPTAAVTSFHSGFECRDRTRAHQGAGGTLVATAEHPFAEHAGNSAGDIAHGFQFGSGIL